MTGRRQWRGIDNDPGWINRMFRDLEAQVRQLRSEKRLEASSVSGGVVTVREILTNPSASIIGEDTDRLYLWDLEPQVWQLAASPLTETLVVRFHPGNGAGIEWKRGEHYILFGSLVLISAAQLAAARAQLGDVFSAQYLRAPGNIARDFLVAWASGWRYLAVSTSDTTDYSRADSSDWSTGTAPLGHNWDGSPGWLPRNTTVDTNVLWIQREVFACEAMTIRVRIEDHCDVYVNGALIGSIPDQGGTVAPETAFVVPASAINTDAPNLVAIKVSNEVPEIAHDLYVDVQVEGAASDA